MKGASPGSRQTASRAWPPARSGRSCLKGPGRSGSRNRCCCFRTGRSGGLTRCRLSSESADSRDQDTRVRSRFTRSRNSSRLKGLARIVVNAVGKPFTLCSESALAERIRIGRRSSSSRIVSKHRQPVDLREHDVQHDQVRTPLLPLLKGGAPICGDPHLIPLEGQVQLQTLGQVRLVFNDQNAFLLGISHGLPHFDPVMGNLKGRISEKTDPFSPSFDSTITLPS